MKLYFSIFVVFFVFFQQNLKAAEYSAEYSLKTKGLLIGKLFWNMNINEDNYSMTLKLSDRGVFSGLYKFKGDYNVYGDIKNKVFYPKVYKQKWITEKKQREVSIFFNKQKISILNLTPSEKEHARVNINDLNNYVDPLTSFLKILNGSKNSQTIDGRRIYKLYNDDGNISIKDYVNIWADHKRNDLSYIEFIRENKNFLMPSVVKIRFKDMLFVLKKI